MVQTGASLTNQTGRGMRSSGFQLLTNELAKCGSLRVQSLKITNESETGNEPKRER